MDLSQSHWSLAVPKYMLQAEINTYIESFSINIFANLAILLQCARCVNLEWLTEKSMECLYEISAIFKSFISKCAIQRLYAFIIILSQ